MGTDKNHKFADPQIKRAQVEPDCGTYVISEDQTKLRRFEDRGFGYGIRAGLKQIALTPGPGDYVNVDCQRATTKNHNLQNGW